MAPSSPTPGGDGLVGVESTGADAAANAMAHLAELVAEVGAGTVRLNRAGDAETFRKQRGIRAYAFDDPLVAAFCLPEAEEDTEEEDRT